MSIEMINPQSILEKVDAAANYVEQMYLTHMMKDEVKFKEAHKKAGDLLFEAIRMIDGDIDDADIDDDDDSDDPNDSRNL